MKKILIILILSIASAGAVIAQGDSGEPGSQNAATVNYSLGDLEKMNKLELTSIYIAKVKRLHNILPFIPFQKLEPSSPNDLKIPAVKLNEKSLKELQKSREDYNQTIEGSLNAIIPYANKKAIIESIVFVQTYINKIELIGLGMHKIE